MAQRRMFSKAVCDTDRFLEMPTSAQALYFHLGLRADDEGFVASPNRIMALCGCAPDDLKLLAAKNFIIPFVSGICVITDWKQHNSIQKDRFHKTIYTEERAMLSAGENGAYTLCIQNGCKVETEVRLGKDNNTLCAELPPEGGPPRRKQIEMILKGGEYYTVYQDQAERWAELYPGVDIPQELRNMAGWLEANADKRKTRRGMTHFINSWLKRTQDKHGVPAPEKHEMTAAELRAKYGVS